MHLVNLHVPFVCHKRVDSSRVYTLPRSLRNLLYRRNQMWRMYRKGVVSARAKYIHLRSRCKSAMHSYLKAREERILHGKDKVRFYSYVKNKLKSAHSISKLILSDNYVNTDDSNIANTFSSEFCKNYSSVHYNGSFLLLRDLN
jgi:hypothetical protein